MKKSSLFAVMALGALVAMTGCQSINTSDSGNMTINPATVGPADAYRPLYEVNKTETVTGTATVHSLFGIFTWGGDGAADYADMSGQDDSFFSKILPNIKSSGAKYAFYDACVKNQCDALVASRYVIKATDYFVYATYEITVKGYPAKQVGIETVKTLPYYIDAGGKVVVLKDIVRMHNVMEDKSSVLPF